MHSIVRLKVNFKGCLYCYYFRLNVCDLQKISSTFLCIIRAFAMQVKLLLNRICRRACYTIRWIRQRRSLADYPLNAGQTAAYFLPTSWQQFEQVHFDIEWRFLGHSYSSCWLDAGVVRREADKKFFS